MTTMCEVMRSVPWWLTFYVTGSVNRWKSVFKKIWVHTSFSYRFRSSVLQRRIRSENAFIPSVRMLKWTRCMRISIYRPVKLAPFLILCCWVLLWFTILCYFRSKRCQEQLQSNQNRKQGAGFESVVLSSLFPELARSEALKYLVSFLWNLSDASAGLNALERASKDWKSFRSRDKPHGSVCPPFWILTVVCSGSRSCLFWWPFSDSIVFSFHTRNMYFCDILRWSFITA